MKKTLHRDVWVGLILFLFSAWVFVLSLGINGQASYLPSALSAMMALCAVAIIARGLSMTKKSDGTFRYTFTFKNSVQAFIFMGFIVVYYLLFRYVSYWIATPIFLIFTQKYLKVKSWKVNLIITIVYMILSYVMFVIVLKLPIYKVGVLGKYFRYIP